MVKRKRQLLRSTLLIVGEGVIDKAFLEYLKSLFAQRGSKKITVRAGDGGSPEDVINISQKKYKHIDYDQTYVFLDSDVGFDPKLATSKKIQIIQSKPICLEGMLLDVLGEKASDCLKCKKLLHPMLSGKPRDKNSYDPLFTKELLENSTNQTIQELISIFK